MVSVIIPVYNVAPYLREALDSVVGQSYPDLQIIMVDDGSTDGSGQICDEYLSDPRVAVIHQKNRGLSAARNIGLDLATGEYIAFLDPDDAFHPDFLRNMLAQMNNADLTICGYTVGHDRLDRGGKDALPVDEGYYDRNCALRALIDGKISPCVWNKLYKRELWKDIRFPDGYNYEDHDTMYRIFYLCKQIYVMRQTLYFYRKRFGSISRTITGKNVEDRSRALLHMEEFIQNHIPEIFSDEHLKKIRQSRLSGMIAGYIKGRMNAEFRVKLRNEIIAIGKETGMEWYSFRIRTGYHIVRICPWLLRIIYPVYRPFRLLVLKVTGR